MTAFSETIFEPNFQLAACHLVEAAAGTGKTYNIQNAYLRHILAGGLRVQNILVVTFTEAATHELRTRLRDILAQCRTFLEWRIQDNNEQCPAANTERLERICNIPLQGSASQQGDAERLKRVKNALRDFDDAAIYTIHGFCKRVLDKYAFECGHDPDAKVLPNASKQLKTITQDCWRKRTYGNSNFRSEMPFNSFADFFKLIQEAYKKPDARLQPDSYDKGISICIADAKTEINQLWDRLNSPESPITNESKLDKLNEAILPIKNELEGNSPNLCALLKHAQVLQGMLVVEWDEDFEGTSEFLELRRLCEPAMKSLADSKKGKKTHIWEGNELCSSAGCRSGDISSLLAFAQNNRDRLSNCKQAFEALPPPSAAAATAMTNLGIIISAELGTSDPNKLASAIKKLPTYKSRPCRPISLDLAESFPNLLPALQNLCKSINVVKVGIVNETVQRARAEILAGSSLTYDAMLLQVRDALKSPETGDRLCNILREEFSAAMVDEFQDTDPIQYDIFKKLFIDANLPLLLVGDPKQAVYSFRGADIFTYYKAKQDIPAANQHALNTNFRSETNLLNAINQFFKEPSADQSSTAEPLKTFRNQNISYPSDLAANDAPDERKLSPNPGRPEKTFNIITYPHPRKSAVPPGEQSATATAMYVDVARDIVGLLNSALKIGERKLKPDDFAVLVMTHKQAEFIQKELLDRGVNAVRQAQGNVFDSDEATGLWRVMRAMISPADTRALHDALAHPLIPCNIAEIIAFNLSDNSSPAQPTSQEQSPPQPAQPSRQDSSSHDNLPQTQEQWINLFSEAGQIWHQRSFIEAFEFIAGRLNLRAFIASLQGGAASLSRLEHLLELAQKEEISTEATPAMMERRFLDYMNTARQKSDEDEDDSVKPRIASDEPAVQIMTVFKSKGLEFPIVFAPTLCLMRSSTNKTFRLYHDDNSNMLISIDPSQDEKDKAQEETMQEQIRIAYVAITRAINRIYLYALHNSEKNAQDQPSLVPMKYLLENLEKRADATDASNLIFKTTFEEFEQYRPDVNQAYNSSSQDIQADALTVRALPNVDKTHGYTSFSALAANLPFRKYDFKSLENPNKDYDSAASEDESTESIAPHVSGIFAIPGGTATGHCMHKIFEKLDFQADAETTAAIVNETIDAFKLCNDRNPEKAEAKRQAVHVMVRNVLNAPLATGQGEPFHLKDISLAARRNEMDFDFRLLQTGAQQQLSCFGDILREHWHTAARDEDFIARLENREAKLPRGFMTAVLDLLFTHNGKFYIIDWKSNRFQSNLENFVPAGLKIEMAEHFYYLQYMLYTVAVHLFLQKSLANYSYEQHIGGAFYIFLRGVDASLIDGNPRGVFFDRLSSELTESLTQFLTAGALCNS